METLKNEIGPNDAIDSDVASAAYVENFALKVFGMADNEDRSGNATRGTAKKFMAAVNFLEVLRVFDNADISESVSVVSDYFLATFTKCRQNDDKIRYAKWKAADIAKAFREGRKPVAGPADQPEPEPQIPETPYPPEISVDLPSPAALPPPFEHGSWPSKDRPEGLNVGGPQSPGAWSTAATPGSAAFPGMQDDLGDRMSPSKEDLLELEVNDDPDFPNESIQAPGSPGFGVGSPTEDYGVTEPQFHESLPPGFVPTHVDGSPITPSAPPFEYNANFSPPSAPIIPPLPPPPVPAQQYQSPSQSTHPSQAPRYNAPPPPPPPAPEAIPTPQQIAKAQKHCRFAVSALDYEDFTQARKDLREALRLVGG